MSVNGTETNPYPEGSAAAKMFERLRSAARGLYARQWSACELLQHESQFLVGELRELERLRTEGKPAARRAAPAHLPIGTRVAVDGDGGALGGVITAVILRGDASGGDCSSYEIGWVSDGQARREWFEAWRVARVSP